MLTVSELSYLFMEEQKIRVICCNIPLFEGIFDEMPIKFANFHVLHVESCDPYVIAITLDG